MSVASMANWAANFVVTVSFLTLLSAISGVGVFFLFGFLTLVASAYFWRRCRRPRAAACRRSSGSWCRRTPDPRAPEPGSGY